MAVAEIQKDVLRWFDVRMTDELKIEDINTWRPELMPHFSQLHGLGYLRLTNEGYGLTKKGRSEINRLKGAGW
jgi:hypothetical protein